jgi:hypothetical protein
MRVCDRCRNRLDKEHFNLKFTNKEFEVCPSCALQVVAFLETPLSLKEKLSKMLGGKK